MSTIVPLIVVLLGTQMHRHGANALVRGERQLNTINAFESIGGGRRGRRFLQMDDGENDGNMSDQETSEPSKGPPPPNAPPPATPSPVAPFPLTAAPFPVTMAPVISLPITGAPVVAPASLPPSPELTLEPSVRVVSPINTNVPSNSANQSPDSASGHIVNLLDFVVSADVTASPDDDIAGPLEALLTGELKMLFDSFQFVQLMLQTQHGSGRALLNDFTYSGTASFESEVSDEAVQDAQVLILQDSDALQEVAPSVMSIEIATDTEDPAAPSASSPGSSVALTIGVVVAAAVAVVGAVYLAYRYFSTPPPPPSRNKKSEEGPSANSKALRGTGTRESSIPDDGSSVAASIYGRDDYSLDGISTTGSEQGLDNTELYLLQRYREKKLRDQKQASSSNAKQPSDYYFSNHDDGSDAGFSYDQVGAKGAESDDDLYTTEPTAIEVALESTQPNKPVFGYFGIMGSGSRRSDDLKQKTTIMTTTILNPNNRSKRDVNEIPFDEASMDRPFDEFSPAKPTLPPSSSLSSKHTNQQANLVAKQGRYEQDTTLYSEQDDDVYNGAVGRTRANASRKSEDSDKEDLSSFLRGRRQAKRAARKNR